jgi:hypothetical protein
LQSKEEAAEALIYSPQGIQAEDLRSLANARPPIQPLALLHGLHDVSIALTKQLNLGAHNVLQVQLLVKAKYWVGTHDEEKIGGEVVARFLRRKIISIQEALDQENLQAQSPDEVSDVVEVSYVRPSKWRESAARVITNPTLTFYN